MEDLLAPPPHLMVQGHIPWKNIRISYFSTPKMWNFFFINFSCSWQSKRETASYHTMHKCRVEVIMIIKKNHMYERLGGHAGGGGGGEWLAFKYFYYGAIFLQNLHDMLRFPQCYFLCNIASVFMFILH